MMLNLTGTTKVFGIFGDPVGHSLSPLMQNRAFAALGIDAVYVPFHVTPSQLEHAVKSISALEIQGLNVTVPHKTAVMDYLDNLTDAARAVGAVNMIMNDNGVLTGDTTDGYGFEMCLATDGGLEKFPERIFILGAGGAARSVVYACAKRDEVREIVIANRTVPKAVKLAEEFSSLTGKPIIPLPADSETLKREIPAYGLIVNTTSVGMQPDTGASPVPDASVFHAGQIVCDIIYAPLKTKLLRDAESQGAQTVGGLAMLAYQGARSLSLWTGRDAPVEVMLDVLRKHFSSMDVNP